MSYVSLPWSELFCGWLVDDARICIVSLFKTADIITSLLTEFDQRDKNVIFASIKFQKLS